MNVPTFILAGAHKCATTSVYALLDSSPSVEMSNPKEPHYFCRDSCRHRLHQGVWDRSAYEQLWANPSSKLKGEASVLYLPFAHEVVQRVSDECESAPKIVVCVRNPVERAYSSYLDVRLKNPDETAPTFAAAVAREIDRGPWRLDGAGSPTLRHLALGRYAGGIETFREAVGYDNVHVVVFDDLIANPAEVLSKLCVFLGIAQPPQLDGLERRNPGGAVWRYPLARAAFRSRAAVALRRQLARNVPAAHAAAKSMTRRRLLKRAPEIDGKTKKLLVDLYSEEIHQLERLVGGSLDHWLDTAS